jgi:hypothetical protein
MLEVECYRRFLEELSPGELKEYARRCGEQDSEEVESRRPFNQPYALAEFDHWTRQALWNLDETCALFLGRDPDLVKFGFVKSLAPASLFAREYCSLRQTLERAQAANILRFPSQPKLLLDWALAVEYPLPEALVSLLKRRRTGDDWWRNELDENKKKIAILEASLEDRDKELESLRDAVSVLKDIKKLEVGSRERTTLYTIIIAMAIDGYGYNPLAERSPTSREIVDAVTKLELSISDETVRSKLKEAVELLPSNIVSSPNLVVA